LVKAAVILVLLNQEADTIFHIHRSTYNVLLRTTK